MYPIMGIVVVAHWETNMAGGGLSGRSPTGWVTVYLETPSGTELDTEPAVRVYTDLEAEAGPCTNACACASKMYNIYFM